MARSADAARASAQPTKAELRKELSRLRARVKELERTNANLEGSNRALRDSEDRLAALVAHMPAVAFVRDLDGRFAHVNRAYEETYAVTNERVRGKPLTDVLPKKAAEAYLAHDRRVIAGKDVVEEEIEVALGGRPHVFSSIKFPIRDANGEMIAVGGIEQDITERKKAERALKEARDAMAQAQARLFDAIESMSDAIVVYDADGRLLFCNKRFKAFYGYTDDEAMEGVTRDDLVKIDIERGAIAGGRQGAESYYGRRAAVRGGLTSSSEVELSDGRWLHVRDRRTSTGGIVSIQADITDRKRAEDRALANERRIRAFAEATPDPTFVLDEAGNYIDVLAADDVSLVKPREELVGRNLVEFFPKEQVEYFLEKIRKAVADNRIQSLEYQIVAGEKTLWFEGAISPIQTDSGHARPVIWAARDITERKQAEEALRQGEARLDLALQATGAGVWDYDLRNGDAWWSPELYNLLGFEPEDLAPSYESWMALLHPEDRERILGAEGQELDDWAASEGSRSEYRLKRKDGVFIWVEDMATATFDDAGKVQRQTGVMRDITQRKEAEAALRQSEERYALAMEGAGEGLWDWDIETDRLDVSPRFLEIMGLDTDRLAIDPMEWVERMHPDDRACYEQELTAHLRGDTEILATEIRVSDGSGGYRWVRPCGLALRDDMGRAYRMAGSLSDMTERRQAEEAVKESREQLNAILESSPAGIAVTRRDSGETVYANARFAEQLGFGEDRNIGRDLKQTWADPEERDRVIVRAKESGITEELEVRRRRQDGGEFWALMSALPITYEGREALLSWTYDITERKRAEQQIKANEQQLRDILEDSPIAIAISVDDQSKDDGIIQFANGRFVDMLGFDPDDIGRARTEQFMPRGEDRDEHERKLDEGESLIDMEVQASRQDGSKLWTLLSLSPIRFNDRQSALIWLYDITERKRAEAEIQQTKERLDLALEGSGDGLWDWNVKTGDQYMDDRWAGMLGYKLEELEGSIGTFERLIHPDDEAEVTANLERVLASHAPSFVKDFRLRSKSGDWVWVLSRGKVVEREEDGTPVRLIGTHSNITERKLAEKKLQDAYSTISESINYASNIQRSVLTEEEVLAEATREHLLLWEPRDVVGGDICWCHSWGDGTLVVLADCTGHGVPGAFMTLIATGALDRAMNEVPPGNVGYLIQRMHQIIQSTLSQESDGGDSDDGLELGACYIRPDWGKLTFAGARLPLFVVENGEVAEVKATRQGIGYRGIPRRQAYEDTKMDLRDGMTFYMTSDGFLDQVGGGRRRMFGKKRFKALLMSLDGRPLAGQKEALHRALADYQGEERRRDDVSMVAFRV